MTKSFFCLNRLDLLMISACGLVFTAILVSHGHGALPSGPPPEPIIQQMAGKLGVTAGRLRHAIEIVPPPARGERPSPEQRAKARYAFAAALDIPAERLDAVMRRHHRPPRD